MRRSFKYKARLSATQVRRADHQLGLLRELYNAAIQERRDAWLRARKSIGFYDQCLQIKDIRRIRPEYAGVDAQVAGMCLYRVHLAFEAFYRRCKAGEKPGYPRFKGRSRFNSMIFRQSGWKLDGKHLTLRGVGRFRLHLSRPVEGKVKTVTLKRDAVGDWWVVFSCGGVPEKLLPETGREVGLDLGLNVFLATSDGVVVENPRHFRAAEADLRRTHRRASRRKRGSKRGRRAVRVLARRYRAVQDARRDFHFKTALDLVRRYDTIAVENLNVRGMARSHMAKSVHDAGWANFLHALRTKAESAGREVVEVDPRGTSQECSECGTVVPKTLGVRVHRCGCGLVLDRDVNAARNILARAGPSASGRRSRAAA